MSATFVAAVATRRAARFLMLAVGKIWGLRTFSQAAVEPWHPMITSQKDVVLRCTGLV